MIKWPGSDDWKRLYPGLCGEERLTISGVCSAFQPQDNRLLFVSKMTEQILSTLMSRAGCLLLLNSADRRTCEALEKRHGLLYSDDPRYMYAEVLSRFCSTQSLRGTLRWDPATGLSLGENVKIDPSAVVEPGTTIGSSCVIGGGVYIMTGARIGPRVQVGEESIIRENSVIGGYGFGFALAKGRPAMRIPHLGGVVVGRHVEIGALCTVCSGTIDPTIIEDGVKLDDHVHVAHNCHLEQGVIVTACAEISGSVRIGQRSWLGPNCSIIDRISVGADCLIGIGAAVLRSLPDQSRVSGNPARPIG